MTIVYGIFNNEDECVYVGSTTSLRNRKATHKYHARIYNDKPIHKFLNNNDYEFKVIKEVPDKDRYIEEALISKGYDNLLNISFGKEAKLETRKKMSESTKLPFKTIIGVSSEGKETAFNSREDLESAGFLFAGVRRVLITNRETYKKHKWSEIE